MSKVYDEAIRILDNKRITIADETVYRPGSLFQVKIPDEDVMLDEQKPFEEQPGKVRKALEKYGHRKATHKRVDAYRGKTGRYDLSNSDAIEEMLADEFIKPASRHEILGKLAKQDKGAVERLVAWMKRVIDRIASVFQNPQGKLTTAQRDAFVTSSGKMAGSLKDQNGKPIFKTYDGYKTIKLANGKELAAEEKTSSNRKYSLDNSDNRRYSVSRITGTQKDELFRQVSSHLSSYIDEQVAKGKNLADLLEELASEHSSHREKLLGGYRATARDFEVRKADKEHRQTVVEAHWPEAKTWTENREAKIKEAYDLSTSQIKEVVDYAGVLYREIVIDRERASRNPEGGIQLHSWRDAERQRAEREAGNHQNSIRPTSRSDESGFSIARSMDELKAEAKEAFPGAKVQESGNKLIFTMPNGQKVTFTFHESISFTIISERGMRRAEVVTFYRHKKKKAPWMSDAQSPEQNVQNDSGRLPSSSISSIPQGQKEVTKENSETKQEKPAKTENDTVKADGEYKYYMNERGVSPSAQPKGFTRFDENDKGGRYGAVYYDHPLTELEIADYELTSAEEEAPAYPMYADEYLRNIQEYDELVREIERREAKETKKAAKAGGQESTAYKSNNNSMDNAAEDVEAVKKSLVELAENAWADKSFHGKVSFKPSQKLKEKIKELMGHDIGKVFITADNMRHLRNHHGEAEEKRGQVNFKPEMAGEIYDVVNDFDSATKERNDNKGNQNVLVVRKGNGDSFALLVERGKKKAEVKTFYKKTKTPLMSDAKSPNLNAQSDSVKSSVTFSVPQEQENVERENFEKGDSQEQVVLKGVEGLWESTIEDYIDRGFGIESYKGHKEGKKLVYSKQI